MVVLHLFEDSHLPQQHSVGLLGPVLNLLLPGLSSGFVVPPAPSLSPDGVSLEILEFPGCDPCLQQFVFHLPDVLILFLHVAGLDLFPLLYIFDLFPVEIGLVR